MSSLSKLLIFTGLITLSSLTVNACSKSTVEPSNLDKKKVEKIVKKDTLIADKQLFFQLPSLLQLAEKSPILKKEGFGNEAETKFIVGNVIILSFDKKLVYLNLLPKTTEDDTYIIHLMEQDLKNNTTKIIKEWFINNSEGSEINLVDFYESSKNEISEIFKNHNLQSIGKKLIFKPYSSVKNIKIKKIFETTNDELEIKTLDILENDKRAISLKQNSKNTFCIECNSLKIYQADFIGQISIENENHKILVLGLLERINLSPSAIHIRFVYL